MRSLLLLGLKGKLSKGQKIQIEDIGISKEPLFPDRMGKASFISQSLSLHRLQVL